MSRFKLAGLLRVRTVQEEQARRDLGRAQVQLHRAGEQVRQRQEALASAGAPAGGPASVFLAQLATRTSLAAAVTEAAALSELSENELGYARDQWLHARMRARAVERLSERHALEEQVALGRAEQAVSDDLAGARHAASRRQYERGQA
ncbi:MAG: flagellar FliJ family protein [Angustibacter sp.]